MLAFYGNHPTEPIQEGDSHAVLTIKAAAGVDTITPKYKQLR